MTTRVSHSFGIIQFAINLLPDPHRLGKPAAFETIRGMIVSEGQGIESPDSKIRKNNGW